MEDAYDRTKPPALRHIMSYKEFEKSTAAPLWGSLTRFLNRHARDTVVNLEEGIF